MSLHLSLATSSTGHIGFFCLFGALLLIDYRSMISSREIECVDIFWAYVFEFSEVFFDKLRLTIKFLTLEERIEDAQRLGVGSDTR